MREPDTAAGNSVPKLSQGDRIFGEWVTFGVLAAVVFGVVLAIPYGYRLITLRWASSNPSVSTGYMGSWVGTLQNANLLKSTPQDAANAPLDPFWSKEGQLNARAADLSQRVAPRHTSRAIYVDLGLDPFHFSSPSLRGKIRMCAYNGAKADFDFTTMSVGETGATLVLTTKASDEFGNLSLKLNDGKLKSTYEIMGRSIVGELTRGSLQDFQKVCDQVKATAQADLPQ